jgi:hypothetical protein
MIVIVKIWISRFLTDLHVSRPLNKKQRFPECGLSVGMCDFLENGSEVFDRISVIIEDHYPKQIWIGGIFTKMTVRGLYQSDGFRFCSAFSNYKRCTLQKSTLFPR